MANNVREALSAFMDNEASEFEVHRVLRESCPGDGSGDAWWRYHLIGSAIRDELGSLGGIDVSGRVAQVLTGEPVATPSVWRSLAKPLTGVAVAAGVAVAVLSAGQFYGSGGSREGAAGALTAVAADRPAPVVSEFGSGSGFPAAGSEPVALESSGRSVAVPAPMGPATGNRVAAQRLQEYLYLHTENASLDWGGMSVSLTPVAREEAR